MDVHYRFAIPAGSTPLRDRYIVFVHLVTEDGTQLFADDHLPHVPTTEWRPGAVIEYTRGLFVPRRMPPGSVHLDAGLYHRDTGERLPLDALHVGQRAYRLASLRIEEPPPVIEGMFVGGWHPSEQAGDRLGTEWRWSGPHAELWFRNPGRDADLIVEFDSAVRGPAAGRRPVELRIGGMLIAGFMAGDERQVRRVALERRQMGDEDILRVSVAALAPVVPAQVPDLASRDTRALGVRIYDAYLDPRSDATVTPPVAPSRGRPRSLLRAPAASTSR